MINLILKENYYEVDNIFDWSVIKHKDPAQLKLQKFMAKLEQQDHLNGKTLTNTNSQLNNVNSQ